MKTTLVFTALLAVALLASSFTYGKNAINYKPPFREIAITSGFQKIIVGIDLQLVLVQDPNKSNILVTGDDDLIHAINVTINKGVLSITSKKKAGNKSIKIYVPVNTLTSLDLARNAVATTEGIVKLDGLKVLIHDGSKIDLAIVGKFEVESDDDSEFVCDKYETSKVLLLH